eukprot:IDg7819t1
MGIKAVCAKQSEAMFRAETMLDYDTEQIVVFGLLDALAECKREIIPFMLFGVLAVSDVVMTLCYNVIVTDIPEREGYVRKIVHDVFDVIHSVANG